MILWIKIEMSDNSIHFMFKVKAIHNDKIANFEYYGKTRWMTPAKKRKAIVIRQVLS